MSIDIEKLGYTPVTLEDTLTYHCMLCGKCCRNVKESVLIESLDLFRLARFLNMSLEEVALKYTVTTLLAWGYPVLMLKTKQFEDTCVFLKSSKCSAHDAKPRTCRTYPLGIGPDDENTGQFLYFIVSRRQHHFTKQRVRVGDLVAASINDEDRAFILANYKATGEIAKIMRKIAKRHEDHVMSLVLFFLYFEYDTEQNFQEQFLRNMAYLKARLSRLAGG